MEPLSLVLSDTKGNLLIHPYLKMLAFDGCCYILPQRKDLIEMEPKKTFFSMPGHAAVGWDPFKGVEARLSAWRGRAVLPVSGFVEPGMLRLYLPGVEKTEPKTNLPLWPYTALGFGEGRFWLCAMKLVRPERYHLAHEEEDARVKKGIDFFLLTFRGNRLVEHLAGCALAYRCPNARNLFLKRGEAPLPVSGVCNAGCLGCLSFQEASCSAASHARITFTPTPEEVAEIALAHFAYTRGRGMVSFGQGCEGEPLLCVDILRKALRLIRKKTDFGTVHLNTNGSDPVGLRSLASSGLDSVRVSVLSFDEKIYNAYYRPRGYGLRDVIETLRVAKKSGLFVSLNLLTMPGMTDQACEAERLTVFLSKGWVDLLQLRNLSVDPFLFRNRVCGSSNPIGMRAFVNLLRYRCKELRIGYFNLVCGGRQD